MDPKTLQTLRVGDTVRIHFTHPGASGRRSEPFNVVVAAINGTGAAQKDDDGVYRESRQIQWYWADLPKDLQPHESVRDNIRGLDTCSEGWIVDIVSRAPYQMQSRVKNSMYAAQERYFVDSLKVENYLQSIGEGTNSFELRQKTSAVFYIYPDVNEAYERRVTKGQYNGNLFAFAQSRIALRSTLSVPKTLDKSRFYAAWQMAGRPGYVGPFVHYQNGYCDSGDVETTIVKALVNRKAFLKWAFKNVHRFTSTKSDLLTRMIENAKVDEEIWARSMDDDY